MLQVDHHHSLITTTNISAVGGRRRLEEYTKSLCLAPPYLRINAMRHDRFRQIDDESLACRSLGGSSRRSRIESSPCTRSCLTKASHEFSCSRRAFMGLKEYSKTVSDIDVFTNIIEDWVYERMPLSSSNKTIQFKPPFSTDSLRELDYALEGVLFQQLHRMPNPHYLSDRLKEEQFLGLEDFLQTCVAGLWRNFWHKKGQVPFFVSCPSYARSKFCTVEKAILKGKIDEICGAAVFIDVENQLQPTWAHVLELTLFKTDITEGSIANFSPLIVCEALFYGFHILLSRSLSNLSAVDSNLVYLLVLDSKYGGVIEFRGDLEYLEINTCSPYHSVVEWIKNHCEIKVSPIDRIWNKLGNPNWGDLGALQILMATYNSISYCKGPSRKSIASLAAEHSLRLRRQRVDFWGLSQQEETIAFNDNEDSSCTEQNTYLKLKKDEVVLLEDSHGQRGFQIKEILRDGYCLSYIVISLTEPAWFLNMYIGVHPSKLEPSWEAMSLWYAVQRQTKVLKVMNQLGVSSKYLPEVITSGRILHPEPCKKTSFNETCDHPLCGSPVLITSPVGETVSSIMALDGPFSSYECLKCCRDILTALKCAEMANLQHGDLRPENVLRVGSAHARTGSFYVLGSWGRAVIEDRDSPALNLQFSSTYALQNRKLCPSSDVESLIYLLYFISGGKLNEQDSIETALKTRERFWSKRIIQQQLGEVSPLLKAFADYIDSIYCTPYPVDYDIWISRSNQMITHSELEKSVERLEVSSVLEDVAESSRSEL